jgi:hypothetical protein
VRIPGFENPALPIDCAALFSFAAEIFDRGKKCGNKRARSGRSMKTERCLRFEPRFRTVFAWCALLFAPRGAIPIGPWFAPPSAWRSVGIELLAFGRCFALDATARCAMPLRGSLCATRSRSPASVSPKVAGGRRCARAACRVPLVSSSLRKRNPVGAAAALFPLSEPWKARSRSPVAAISLRAFPGGRVRFLREQTLPLVLTQTCPLARLLEPFQLPLLLA